jgi:hypothetical protein
MIPIVGIFINTERGGESVLITFYNFQSQIVNITSTIYHLCIQYNVAFNIP